MMYCVTLIREINWQQFESQLLSQGLVEKVIVTNKTTAKVILKPEANVTVRTPGGDSAFGWSSDSSVDAGSGGSGGGTSALGLFDRIKALKQQQAEQQHQAAYTQLSPFEQQIAPPTIPPQAPATSSDQLLTAIRRDEAKQNQPQPPAQPSFYFNIG